MPEVGIREGERLHEIVITHEDSLRTYEYDRHYVVYLQYNWWSKDNILPNGTPVQPELEYSSGKNIHFLTIDQIKEKLKHGLYRE